MLKLHNTLTKSEEFADFPSKEVKIYLCGPTVQSSPHIGHGRSAVVFDFLVRYLNYTGKEVIFARNITDIDDKIIEKSLEQGITHNELTTMVSKEFDEAYLALNCKKPNYQPKATESIEEIINLIKLLEEKEIAYQTSSGVYFDISKYDNYLELSGRSLEDLISGTRVGLVEDKKNNEDFALWKFAKENEPSWESPWGLGRPGWHIECSAMIHGLFGNQGIDIHCGGNDLIFPHHENERAQSEAAFNEKFVNFWLHNGMVNLSGKKMSKSEGNIKLLNDYISMFDGNTIRYFFLRANYRKPQEFSENLLHESDKTFKNIITFIGDVTSEPIDEHLLKLFEESMNDDLNTPKFIGEMFNYMNLNANKNEEKTLGIRSTIRYIFETLGFVFTTSDKSQNEEKFKEFFIKYNIKFSDIDSSMSNYLSLRQELRDKKEYESADNMRKDIEDIGIIIEDGIESGWRWSTS